MPPALAISSPTSVTGRSAATGALPALFAAAGERGATRFIEFFTAHIRNPHTRRAYFRAISLFSAWCAVHGIRHPAKVAPIHVAAYIEQSQDRLSKPSVKQHLAALRILFDWLVVGQVVPTNPASSVRGPKHAVKQGKTPVLTSAEARTLLDSIDVSTIIGRRDRALIALMSYTFARVGAMTKMLGEDYFVQNCRGWVRLHEKGRKEHPMPCHHNLERYLDEYIDAAGIGDAKKRPLFRSSMGRTGRLSDRPMAQADVFRMVGRRARAAGIETSIGCHTFRATGITAYLKNGGRLEVAQQMANHESARTTGLYDRRGDEISLDEVERIGI